MRTRPTETTCALSKRRVEKKKGTQSRSLLLSLKKSTALLFKDSEVLKKKTLVGGGASKGGEGEDPKDCSLSLVSLSRFSFSFFFVSLR